MQEHFRHIFIEQVYRNEELIQRLMYAKDGTLIHDFFEDDECSNAFTNEQLHFFTQQFFDKNYQEVGVFKNRFLDDLIQCSKDDLVYDGNGFLLSFKSLLYEQLFVVYDAIGFPIEVHDKDRKFIQRYQYDENYLLVLVDDNQKDIYRFAYVFYEDIYGLLEVQSF